MRGIQIIKAGGERSCHGVISSQAGGGWERSRSVASLHTCIVAYMSIVVYRTYTVFIILCLAYSVSICVQRRSGSTNFQIRNSDPKCGSRIRKFRIREFRIRLYFRLQVGSEFYILYFTLVVYIAVFTENVM